MRRGEIKNDSTHVKKKANAFEKPESTCTIRVWKKVSIPITGSIALTLNSSTVHILLDLSTSGIPISLDTSHHLLRGDRAVEKRRRDATARDYKMDHNLSTAAMMMECHGRLWNRLAWIRIHCYDSCCQRASLYPSPDEIARCWSVLIHTFAIQNCFSNLLILICERLID